MPSDQKYDHQEIRANRDRKMPWKDICAMYGPNVKPSSLRARHYRWLATPEGQKAPKYTPPQAAYLEGDHLVILSRPDNTYLFGVAGDRHHGSKYHRNDVLQDLYRRFNEAGVDLILDTGNWIDGDARFNKHDLTRIGLDPQLALMAEETPAIDVPTFAVWGDCHEGWYASREGIDVGKHAQTVMREAGHDWTNLGYLEAYIVLRNVNTGAETVISLQHPGGGSAYALSYRPQKIVEALEGGEKPSVIIMGHYHKLEALNLRNVWVQQAGTCCDQTPFMRKKAIEAHVGGVTLGMEQDPETGAIIGFSSNMHRYFNRGFYNKRWNPAGPVVKPPRVVVPQKGN